MNKRMVLMTLVLGLWIVTGCSTPPTPTPVPPTPVPPTVAPKPTDVPKPTVAPAPTAAPKPTDAPKPTVAPAAVSKPTDAPKETGVTLTWIGHSTFVLKTSAGFTALLDPINAAVGYALPASIPGVDAVTMTHEHADHNNVALAAGSPQLLRGLAGNDWAKIDQTIKGVRIRTANTYHDATQGSERGKNAVFVFEADGLKLAHLGDLGHKLDAEQIKAIGAVDVILIPVGGFFTVDGKTAAEVVGQLNPKIVVPMHYKTPDLGASLAGRLADAEGFLAALGSSAKVERVEKTIPLAASKLPATRTVMIMNYK